MNGPLRRLSVAVMLLFGLLLVNVNYLQVVRAEDLHNDSSNPRLIAEEYSRERGPIIVADDPVARSVETDDRLKYRREYVSGPIYAPATGFYSLVYGATGIEQEANSILAGTDDSLFVRRVIDTFTGVQPKGGSVTRTLNYKAQGRRTRGWPVVEVPWSSWTRPRGRSSRWSARPRTTRTSSPPTTQQRCATRGSG